MSQYMQFFIRCEDKFVPMCSFSRNDIVYKAFAYDIPYGNIISLTEHLLHAAESYLTGEEDELNAKIKAQQDLIESIRHFNNSVDDKLDAINSAAEVVYDFECGLRQVERAKNLVDFFETILMEAKYRDNDCPLADYTENTVLYAGIEVPAYPTMDDVDPNK